MKNFWGIVDNIESYICRFLLAVFVCLLFLQVVVRTVFNFSFSWVEELSVYMFVWFVFFGASYAAKMGAHNRVTFQLKFLPPRAIKYIEAFADLFWICFNVYFVYLAIDFIFNRMNRFQSSQTQAVRADDDKGRHTTTGRALHRLPSGGWLVDTPGMRELQLTDVDAGLDEVFADIVELSERCAFRDCRHETEPDCAVLAAIETGGLDADRLRRWRKLAAENAYNSETLAERRARYRSFGKMVRGAQKAKKRSDPG